MHCLLGSYIDQPTKTVILTLAIMSLHLYFSMRYDHQVKKKVKRKDRQAEEKNTAVSAKHEGMGPWERMWIVERQKWDKSHWVEKKI